MARTERPSVASLLIYLLVVIYGSVMIYRQYGTPEGVSWWAMACVVLGSIALVMGLVTLIHPALTPAEAAEQLLEQQKTLYSGLHEFRAATAEDFRGLDEDFYQRSLAALKQRGFRHLGDVVDVTTSNAWPRAQAVLRLAASADGTVGVAAYHVRFFGLVRLMQILGLLPRQMKIYDVTTELNDGLQIITCNTLESDKTGPVPEIDRSQHPMITPLEQLLELHADHVKRLRAQRPHAAPVPFRTLQDVLESENRQQMLKNQHKQRVGYLPREEMRRISGRDELTEAEEEVVDEMQLLEMEMRQRERAESETQGKREGE